MTDTSITLVSPQRWDQPFDPEMSDEIVQRVLSMSPFDKIETSSFPRNVSLNGIIKNDSAVRKYRNGDIIIREGDYGSSAFFIFSGDVRVVLSPSLSPRLLGRREPNVKGFWSALSQLWSNSNVPEERDPATYNTSKNQLNLSKIDSLEDVESIKENYQTIKLQVGEIFGELSALSRTSRVATVIAEGDVEVLELQWEGLRDIRNKSDSFKHFIDENYRDRSLEFHLNESPLFSHLSRDDLEHVVEATQFETYGNFNWYAPFKSLQDQRDFCPLESEPEIAKEGHYINGLILIRAGFARQSQKLNHGKRTLNYLGSGDIYGLNEIVHNWKSQHHLPNGSSLSAMGYVDVLRIPTAIVEKYVLPALPESILKPITKANEITVAESKQAIKSDNIDGFLEFLVRNRFINGTQSMLIDMDRCTGCDDCVRACASAHDNNPRFVRHGKSYENIMVANSCMHCMDPVCMIGCPTGAISRDTYQGQVIINDTTCIGCGSCATSCPYNNIRMVEIRDKQGNFIIKEETHTPVLKATKCDLCIDQKVSPACEQACPHDALIRMDMCDSDQLKSWLNR